VICGKQSIRALGPKQSMKLLLTTICNWHEKNHDKASPQFEVLTPEMRRQRYAYVHTQREKSSSHVLASCFPSTFSLSNHVFVFTCFQGIIVYPVTICPWVKNHHLSQLVGALLELRPV
jgi:hypothetical protein